jgi:hypothetical protein
VTVSVPRGARVTVAQVRAAIGVPPEGAAGIRDVLAIPCTDGDRLPDGDAARPLALGDLPEDWRDSPAAGPRFLVVLRGTGRPWLIAGVWKTDPTRWAEDTGGDPQRRLVPLLGPAFVPSAALTGALLDAPLSFGWTRPEEKYAFL